MNFSLQIQYLLYSLLIIVLLLTTALSCTENRLQQEKNLGCEPICGPDYSCDVTTGECIQLTEVKTVEQNLAPADCCTVRSTGGCSDAYVSECVIAFEPTCATCGAS